MDAGVGVCADLECPLASIGAHIHLEIPLPTYSLAEYVQYSHRGDFQGVKKLMLSSANKLGQSGLTF